VAQESNCVIVTVTGRIDSYTAPQFSDSLQEVTQRKEHYIILDLGNVSYVSSAGLRVLIDTRKTCKKLNKGDLTMVSVPPRVYETLELAGFTPLFRFYANVPAALEQC